jgi:hypothetical protein
LSDSKYYCSHCKSNQCCCSIKNENDIQNNPTNTNTFNPTFNPTINVNPVINVSSSNIGEKGLLTEFAFETISFTPEGIDVPNPVTTSSPPLILNIDDITDRVFLNATIVWAGGVNQTTVRFEILRNNTTIVATPFDDTADTHQRVTTTFVAVDETPISTNGEQQVSYTILARLLFGNNADFDFGFFTGAEIESNNPTNP